MSPLLRSRPLLHEVDGIQPWVWSLFEEGFDPLLLGYDQWPALRSWLHPGDFIFGPLDHFWMSHPPS